jgi:orotidine-5'-phosphate decarboxylase
VRALSLVQGAVEVTLHRGLEGLIDASHGHTDELTDTDVLTDHTHSVSVTSNTHIERRYAEQEQYQEEYEEVQQYAEIEECETQGITGASRSYPRHQASVSQRI